MNADPWSQFSDYESQVIEGAIDYQCEHSQLYTDASPAPVDPAPMHTEVSFNGYTSREAMSTGGNPGSNQTSSSTDSFFLSPPSSCGTFNPQSQKRSLPRQAKARAAAASPSTRPRGRPKKDDSEGTKDSINKRRYAREYRDKQKAGFDQCKQALAYYHACFMQGQIQIPDEMLRLGQEACNEFWKKQ